MRNLNDAMEGKITWYNAIYLVGNGQRHSDKKEMYLSSG